LDNQTDTLFPVLLTASYQPGAAQDDPLFPFFYAKLVKVATIRYAEVVL
jgi:hypothetical protein